MRHTRLGWATVFWLGAAFGCGSSDSSGTPEVTAPSDGADDGANAGAGDDIDDDLEPIAPADDDEPADEPGMVDDDGEPSDPSDEGPGDTAQPSDPGEMIKAPMVPAIDDPSISSPSVTVPDTISHAMHADGTYDDLRGRCEIESGYPGDEACIPPPPEDEGFQIHIGPRDYDDEAEVAKFLMMPGGESSECWTFHTPNEEEIVYQTAVLSGRSGTHHIITTMYGSELEDGGFTACAGAGGNTLGSLPGASKPYMPRNSVAPENAHIGRKIPAKVAAQADMHYFNITEEPIIREFWLNIYYAKDEVTEYADQIRAMGGFGWNGSPIPPGADQVYKYECPVTGEGRILLLLGHYHAQGKRFTASIRRANGDVEKVFEMYDYLDPAIFEYNSLLKNPDFSDGMAGAVSGMLPLHDGDTVLWECHIQNNLDVGLTYTNEVVGGEMCNLWGSSVGVQPLNCLRP